jgi:ABC-type proline/glycine betaine transport system substrate-binding protein
MCAAAGVHGRERMPSQCGHKSTGGYLWASLGLIAAIIALGGTRTQVMEYPVEMVWYEGNLDVTWEQLEKGYDNNYEHHVQGIPDANGHKFGASIYPEVWMTEGDGEKYREYVRVRETVQSAGPLGVLGRNGWFCQDYLLDQFPELAGWRGLRNEKVAKLFSNRLVAWVPEWGPTTEIMAYLNVSLSVEYFKDEALAKISEELEANHPTLFYVWSPHALLGKYALNRLSLLPGTNEMYKEGRADYPNDVIEKVYSKTLIPMAPQVIKLLSRYGVDNAMGSTISSMVSNDGMSLFDGVCKYLRDWTKWRANWVPQDEECEGGSYYNKTLKACVACPPGYSSKGGLATSCKQCAPGQSRSCLPMPTARCTAHAPQPACARQSALWDKASSVQG